MNVVATLEREDELSGPVIAPLFPQVKLLFNVILFKLFTSHSLIGVLKIKYVFNIQITRYFLYLFFKYVRFCFDMSMWILS